METPWSRARKIRSTEQEKKIGRLPGGKQQINSGRHWRWKRDATLHEFLIEARTTEAGSYRVERKEFEQIRAEALRTPPGLLPGMQVDIQGLELIVIQLNDFIDLYNRLVKLEMEHDEGS